MDLDCGAGCGVAERIAASIRSVTPGGHLAVPKIATSVTCGFGGPP